ncbi:N-acetylmuramoyl-L-alanine amidase [Crassaminicella indica]|uniref:N-acetylmuramoyl-L-alanine amidase n=1 Tax=Crassaminicella indica TaxID=2855394 RepID=A0ABX8RFJ7_9CLOT|nr:N-acetylmuramoyl-L-alanine amidase [Crassaminicella indica]QXM06505.1 N-acetylmuramoyl-L-alanine amidase [Crassaminicella indica]
MKRLFSILLIFTIILGMSTISFGAKLEQYITDITYDHYGSTSKILIKTTGLVAYNTMYLPGSRFGGNDRLIIDIPNAKFNMTDPSFTGNGGIIKKEINMDHIMDIRGSIFEDYPRNVSRIVIDLAMKKDYHVAFNNELSAIQVEFPNSEKIEEALNSVNNINLETRNNSDVIVIHTKEQPVYNIMDFGNKVVIDVLNARLNIDKNEIPIKQGGVKRIRTAQFANDIDGEIVRIVLDIEDGQSLKNIFVEHEGTDILVYTNKKTNLSSSYRGKIIVIDPGHGGKDPGTHNSALNLVEKELTLDTAKRLNDLLEKSGFITYMTRTDDTTLDLYGRPAVANELDAAVFVSVHYNYAENKKVSGVEMLYVDDPTRDCKRFAKTLQEEMIKALKAKDRGIKNEPEFVVIRETKMPAVIAEVGFISNPAEGNLIRTTEYRQKAAQALFNGIKRYFDERLN